MFPVGEALSDANVAGRVQALSAGPTDDRTGYLDIFNGVGR